jgi:hypothetical protein
MHKGLRGACAVLFVACGCAGASHIALEPKQPVLRTRMERVQVIAHVMTSHMEDGEAKVTWSSENPAIAKVDETGTVQGVASGRTSIVATWKNPWGFISDPKELTASVPIEVLFVEKVSTDMPKVELSRDKGDPASPQITVTSYDGLALKDRALQFEVKDSKICRVNASGQLWPVDIGETVVTASVDNHTVDITCTVTK